ncbi:hypothetical protein [Aurantiacibacter sediminis]|uniref:hypothetical protein n=1 Tax=Aurantiacibacter sediminis TaxID=2793064 RepID=UPI0030DA81E7
MFRSESIWQTFPCAVLIGSEEIGANLGLKPRARIIALAAIGSELCLMLDGPEHVVTRLFARTRLAVKDIDMWELNKSFAAVVLRLLQAHGIDPQVMNVNGGAIAMGHPLGATGDMLIGTALDELGRRGGNRVLISLCAASCQATGVIIERCH